MSLNVSTLISIIRGSCSVRVGVGSGISDFWVFWNRGVELVRVFLYFGSDTGIFSSNSVISDRVQIFKF